MLLFLVSFICVFIAIYCTTWLLPAKLFVGWLGMHQRFTVLLEWACCCALINTHANMRVLHVQRNLGDQ